MRAKTIYLQGIRHCGLSMIIYGSLQRKRNSSYQSYDVSIGVKTINRKVV